MCAYYGWLNLDNLSAYNRVRYPLVQAAYLRFLEKERVARDIRIVANRGWNLMHREFPEGIVKNPSASCERIDSIWPFIAGEKLTSLVRSRLERKRLESIGTAKGLGFSSEMISYAERVCNLHNARLQIKREFDSFLARDEYAWMKPVFDEFGFSTFDIPLS